MEWMVDGGWWMVTNATPKQAREVEGRWAGARSRAGRAGGREEPRAIDWPPMDVVTWRRGWKAEDQLQSLNWFSGGRSQKRSEGAAVQWAGGEQKNECL